MAGTIGITVRRRSFSVLIVVHNIITVDGRIVDAQSGWRAGSNNNIVALDGVCRIRTEDLTVYTPLSVFIIVCNQGLLRNDRINFYDDTIKNIKGI